MGEVSGTGGMADEVARERERQERERRAAAAQVDRAAAAAQEVMAANAAALVEFAATAAAHGQVAPPVHGTHAARVSRWSSKRQVVPDDEPTFHGWIVVPHPTWPIYVDRDGQAWIARPTESAGLNTVSFERTQLTERTYSAFWQVFESDSDGGSWARPSVPLRSILVRLLAEDRLGPRGLSHP